MYSSVDSNNLLPEKRKTYMHEILAELPKPIQEDRRSTSFEFASPTFQKKFAIQVQQQSFILAKLANINRQAVLFQKDPTGILVQGLSELF